MSLIGVDISILKDQNDIPPYLFVYSLDLHHKSYFKEYKIDSKDSNNCRDIVIKARQFIKVNKITSQKKFNELETLFKLQVLN